MKKFALALVLLAAACASNIPKPTPVQLETAQVRWPEATFEELEEGRTLYVRRCSGCHNLHLPSEYTVEEWPRHLKEMGSEYAKLEPAEEDLVLQYIISALEMPPPAAEQSP